MKKQIAAIAICVIALTTASQAATGFFSYLYVVTNLNGAGNVFNQVRTGTTPGTGAASGYNLAADGVNPQFLSFGTLNSSSNLTLKGFEYKTFNDNSSNVTHANLYYRIYSGTPSGSFTQIQTDTPLSVSGNNKTWQVTNGSTNLLSGLSNGNYTMEIYTESYTNGVNTAGNIFGFVSGTNPTATFTVVPEPSTWALLAGGLTMVMVLRRRRIS
ncbi:MAG: PEP-CTERM sorting domain-containing protein [Verrucomicrobia bacterium]|nr:PEP-CTERM sorting domain-containing protein [Verrucomicrobiota bacterium]